MPTTILAIIFFGIGLGIGMLIEHLRFILGDRMRLDGHIEDLRNQLAGADREITKLTRENGNLHHQLEDDVFRRILETDGWMPLKGACLPADGERIKVAGVKTDQLQMAPAGYHYARFKNGTGRLSSRAPERWSRSTSTARCCGNPRNPEVDGPRSLVRSVLQRGVIAPFGECGTASARLVPHGPSSFRCRRHGRSAAPCRLLVGDR